VDAGNGGIEKQGCTVSVTPAGEKALTGYKGILTMER
jgi:hypothetical protein